MVSHLFKQRNNKKCRRLVYYLCVLVKLKACIFISKLKFKVYWHNQETSCFWPFTNKNRSILDIYRYVYVCTRGERKEIIGREKEKQL